VLLSRSTGKFSDLTVIIGQVVVEFLVEISINVGIATVKVFFGFLKQNLRGE
jgi:hypothetical protein